MGILVVHCALFLSSLKLNNVHVEFYSASLAISSSAPKIWLNSNALIKTMASSSYCVIHDQDEDVSRILTMSCEPDNVWTLKTQKSISNTSKSCSVMLQSSDDKQCKHAESEKRIQYTAALELHLVDTFRSGNTTVLQISKANDHVCFTLLRASKNHFGFYSSLLVLICHKYYDIEILIDTLRHHRLSSLAIALLYC